MGVDCGNCSDEKSRKLLAVIEAEKDNPGSLIRILHEAQEIYGYLPIEVQQFVADNTGIPLAEIYGVVTFYAQFSLKPKGQNKINVCLGTACYVKGAEGVLERLKQELKLDVGDCTEDGKFSLDACRCVGACGLAPVIMINDDCYGRLVPDQIPGILAKY
ncbi:MAG: NAD(P)H-dependent oxidoreductase subunit E [Clostridia bacterium]|nr:NAD(P)H-dependent oxidoreductase subunit E [Clostridia bacterium]